jgi:GDP-4-dehydro-6-deoxy-D-mannose reductase
VSHAPARLIGSIGRAGLSFQRPRPARALVDRDSVRYRSINDAMARYRSVEDGLRALITGVHGFAGPHLVEMLRAETAWELYGLGRSQRPPPLGYHPICVDLLDRDRLHTLVAEIAPTHVFHLAAQSHVPTSHTDGGATLINNIIGQTNLLDACRALPSSPRILVVGSGEEYGRATPEQMPLREDCPFNPTSPYAVSKIAQDYLGLQYCTSYGLPIVRVRPFNHIGPGQSDRFVVPAFARQIARIEAGQQEPVVRVGNLEARRDFVDVRDVVRAYFLALTRGEPGEVYNVGGGTVVSIGEVLELLLSLSAAAIAVEPNPDLMRPSDVPLFVADSTRLRAATGWEPTIPFARSLHDILDWWRNQLGVRQHGTSATRGA